MTPPARSAAAPELDPRVLPGDPPAEAPRPRRQDRPGAPRLRIASSQPQRRSTLRVAGPILMGLLFACVLGIAVFQALLVQTQSRIDELEDATIAEEARSERLRVELAALESPSRIVAEAQERLGMIPPEEVLYLQHDPDALGADATAEGGLLP